MADTAKPSPFLPLPFNDFYGLTRCDYARVVNPRMRASIIKLLVGEVEWVPKLKVHVDRLFAKGQDQNLSADLERDAMK